MSEELKPCPFCGATPQISVNVYSDGVTIICFDCGFVFDHLHKKGNGSDVGFMNRKWNKRA